MLRRFGSLSLGSKALLLVCLVAAVVLTALFAANALWQRQGALAQMEAASRRTADLVQLVVSEPKIGRASCRERV